MTDQLFEQIDCVEVVKDETAPVRSARDVATLTVWVQSGRVKPGNVVTFKETGDKLWSVEEIYRTKITGVNRGWGLDLPKSQRTER